MTPSESATDEALLGAWGDGDAQAGKELFARHYPAMLRFFANKVGNDAPDLVQKTFLTLLESRSNFRAEASFRTFLFGIARNVLLHHLRGKVRGGVLDELRTSIRDLDPSPSTIVAQRQQDELLLEALRSLPISAQLVLELYYWESMTANAIAAILEVPEGTARTRIRKAKEELAQRLPSNARVIRPGATSEAAFEQWARELRDRAIHCA